MEKNMSFSYAEMFDARMACVRRFGSVFDLPVIEDIYSGLPDLLEGRLLDFGAGPKSLKNYMSARFPGLSYFSLDADPAYGCDFRCLEDIPDTHRFSLIIANQVLEHLTLEDGLAVVQQLAGMMESGGFFFATVPNTAHPNRFISNCDHKTYLSYVDLQYLCSSARLEIVGLYRYSKRRPRGWLETFLAAKIGAIYRMDWADSIAVVAKKVTEQI